MTSAAAVEARARRSDGTSAEAIYEMVATALRQRDLRGRLIVDVGCGRGRLREHVRDRFAEYVGVDVVRYDGFPSDAVFEALDLDAGRLPLPDGTADVVAAVETIEHLENPRAFVRELTRITRPGGSVIVTTPNQRSLLSLFTLLVKGRFSAFQDVHYPAHLTALLDVDLLRIAGECGLVDAAVRYSGSGRLVLTATHYPGVIARRFPRAMSDNVLLVATRREDAGERARDDVGDLAGPAHGRRSS